ncbi:MULTISPECIES: N-acyl homoserine lactonase family protein [Enterocloster]|uniref:Glyoxylase, beta-lactamase superfamily II n=1 Tax=Enterocloster lavalensis TaxID=460384 RepID=A0A1I0IER7_9FIRM|nr:MULTISPECIES: N-acyl homoserine lactonase family protein [Enterocloster]MDR3756483.1 N-acyl homoserine lactonase family protein [Enterocloster sp.]SET95298.1 Glyoxylase, beta-lactamase superfamily II [Enterocloster lavalensis]
MGITITPLNSGFCTSNPKTYHYHPSTHKYYANVSGEDRRLPVFCYLLNTGSELILVDTGMADSDRANRYHHPGSEQLPDQAMPRAVEKAGYRVEDISRIIFTHLHWDHTFYMKEFSNAKYYAQKKEYEFALNPLPLYYKSYEYQWLGLEAPFLGCEFQLLDGEEEIVPGIRVYPTPGHSPGHQAVEVDTGDGTYHLVGDAVFLMDNFKPIPEIGYDVTPSARFVSLTDWWESVREIKRRCPNMDMILPTHEPALVERFAKTLVLGG